MYIYICMYVCMYMCILLYMCPHTTIYVSAYCYICVRILLYMPPRFAHLPTHAAAPCCKLNRFATKITALLLALCCGRRRQARTSHACCFPYINLYPN